MFGRTRTPRACSTSMSEWRADGSMRRTRDRDHLGAARLDRVGERLHAREAARAEDQPRAEGDVRDGQRVAHPPCTAVTASTFDPSWHGVRRPLALRDDLAVDGDGDAARVGVDAEVAEQLGDRRAVAAPDLAAVERGSCGHLREAVGRERGRDGRVLAGERAGEQVAGHGREQDAVAVVAGRPVQAGRAPRSGRAPARCPACPGAARRAAPRPPARADRARARRRRAGARGARAR